MLILVYGLPGSGKTYFASHFAGEINAVHISSDLTRMRILEERSYSEDEKDYIYREMAVETMESLKKGKTVIVDATFYKEENRELFIRISNELGIAFRLIEICADEDDIRKRTSGKRVDSEADFDVYKQIKTDFEPVKQDHLSINSSELPLDEMIYRASIYISK